MSLSDEILEKRVNKRSLFMSFPNMGLEVDITRTRYSTSKEGLSAAGLRNASEGSKPHFVWIDGVLSRDEAQEYEPYQRINKIPGMNYICYKSVLFTALNEARHNYPNLFNIYPKTFLLPNEYPEFQREHTHMVGKTQISPTWVVKPRNGCCGKGITLIQTTNEACAFDEAAVCQLYIDPFLINQKKFDFRFYLLVASLDPLVLFIYKEGIARFCTDIYQPPTRSTKQNVYAHLTNTAINVENATVNPEEFTKKASEVLEQISKVNQYAGKQLWSKICEASRAVVIGTMPYILAGLPTQPAPQITQDMIDNPALVPRNSHARRSLSISPDVKKRVVIPKPQNQKETHKSINKPKPQPLKPLLPIQTHEEEEEEENERRRLTRRYFHILGIDIMINSDVEPMVLELNDRPSLSVTVPFEKDLKIKLIRDTFCHVLDNGEVAGNNEQSDWEQIYPLGPNDPKFSVWDPIYPQFTIPSKTKIALASSNATNRMMSKGINQSLHNERRQRFNQIKDANRGVIRFNPY